MIHVEENQKTQSVFDMDSMFVLARSSAYRPCLLAKNGPKRSENDNVA